MNQIENYNIDCREAQNNLCCIQKSLDAEKDKIINIIKEKFKYIYRNAIIEYFKNTKLNVHNNSILYHEILESIQILRKFSSKSFHIFFRDIILYLQYLISNIEELFYIYRSVNLFKFKNLLLGLLKPVTELHEYFYQSPYVNLYQELISLINLKINNMKECNKEYYVNYLLSNKLKNFNQDINIHIIKYL